MCLPSFVAPLPAHAEGNQIDSSGNGVWTATWTPATSGTKAADSVSPAAAGGYCEGTAYRPYITYNANSKAGITFSASQTCNGDFYDQQVCAKLQEGTSQGWYNRTTLSCSPITANGYVYLSKWAGTCTAAGHGSYRTAAKGSVDTPYGTQTSGWHYSSPITLC